MSSSFHAVSFEAIIAIVLCVQRSRHLLHPGEGQKVVRD